MRFVSAADLVTRSPMPGAPLATVYFGDEGSTDVGMVRVDVPPGAAMPPHKHHGSDVILTLVAGAVRITKGEEVIEVGTGDAALILKDELVALANPYEEPARLIVAAGPADFVTSVQHWPASEAATTRTPA